MTRDPVYKTIMTKRLSRMPWKLPPHLAYYQEFGEETSLKMGPRPNIDLSFHRSNGFSARTASCSAAAQTSHITFAHRCLFNAYCVYEVHMFVRGFVCSLTEYCFLEKDTSPSYVFFLATTTPGSDNLMILLRALLCC